MDVLKYINGKKRQRKEMICALKRINQTPDGQQAVKYLLSLTHILDCSYSEDQYQTAFMEGERNIGLQIIRALEMPMDELLTLYREEEQNE
jgi:hypothetical protein